jgi:hypothetical protein
MRKTAGLCIAVAMTLGAAGSPQAATRRRTAPPAVRRPAPHVETGLALRVTARSVSNPTPKAASGTDLVTLTAAGGEHELAEILIESSARIAPQVAFAGDARFGSSMIPRGQFGLAPQAEAYQRPGMTRYWLGVQVPPAAKPGTYRLPLRIFGGPAPRTVTIALQVLPIKLTGASKQYAVHFGPPTKPVETSASPTPAETPVPGSSPAEQELRERLARLRQRGVGIVGFDRPAGEMAAALMLARDARFRGPIPCAVDVAAQNAPEQIAAVAGACREHSLPRLMWVVNGDQPLKPAVRSAVRQSGGVVAVVLDALGRADAASGADTVLFGIHAPTVRTLMEGRSTQPLSRPEWLTWTPANETPLRNRLYAGFLLWKAGLAGAYWHAEESQRFWSPRSPDFRHLEGVGEGIEDARYLTMLASLMRQIRDMDRKHPLPDKIETRLRAMFDGLTPDSSEAQVVAARKTLTAGILAAQAVVH